MGLSYIMRLWLFPDSKYLFQDYNLIVFGTIWSDIDKLAALTGQQRSLRSPIFWTETPNQQWGSNWSSISLTSCLLPTLTLPIPINPTSPPPKKNLVMPSTKPDLVLYFYCEYRIFLPVIVAAVPMNHRCDKCSRLEVLHWITIGCAPTWLLDLILSIVSKDEWPWPTSRLPLQWSAVTVTPSGIGKSITVTNCHSNSSFLRALK